MAYGIGGYVKKRKEKDSAGQNREQKERTGLNHEDLALKTAAQYFGDELLPILGIPGRVKYIAPTENVKLQARQMCIRISIIFRGPGAGFIWSSKAILLRRKI